VLSRHKATCRTIKTKKKQVGIKYRKRTREGINNPGVYNVFALVFVCVFRYRPLLRVDHSSRGVLPIVCDQVQQQPSTPITQCVQAVRQNTVMHCITYFSVTSRISNIPLCPLFHTTQSWLVSSKNCSHRRFVTKQLRLFKS
jgi:hypothetical protein